MKYRISFKHVNISFSAGRQLHTNMHRIGVESVLDYKIYCLKLDTNMHGIEEEDMLPAVGNLLLALVEQGTR